MSDDLASFKDSIEFAKANRAIITISGNNTRDFYGNNYAIKKNASNIKKNIPLSTLNYSGIKEFEPSELYITARAGTSLIEIENTLRQANQGLAFDAPNINSKIQERKIGATLGGAVAAGWCGPDRMATGPLSHAVLGIRVMNGDGNVLRFGGTVIKNVAGYDVSRLYAGSWGTLGLMLDITLKVLPLPEAEATLLLPLPQVQALELLSRWHAKPLALTASAWLESTGVFALGFRGSRVAVERSLAWIRNEVSLYAHAMLSAVPEMQELPNTAGPVFWGALRNQTHPFFSAPAPALLEQSAAQNANTPVALWRISLPLVTPALSLQSILPSDIPPLWAQSPQLLEWHGCQRWMWLPATRSVAQTIRAAAKLMGGHATLWRYHSGENFLPQLPQNSPASDADVPIFQAVDPVMAHFQEQLRQKFDPHGIFATERIAPTACEP